MDELDLVHRIAGMFGYADSHEIHERLRMDGHSEADIFLAFQAARILHKDRTGEWFPIKKVRKVTIRGRGDDVALAHKLTQDLRYSDDRVKYSLTVTQVWTWKGGDAIVVLVKNPYGNLPLGHTVIRVGKKVQVIEAPLVGALRQVGIQNFKIV